MTPPLDSGGLPATVGLTSAAAGDGVVQVRWSAVDASGQSQTIAIFGAASHASVYQGAPLHTATGSGVLALAGVPNGVDRFYGLALDLGGGNHEPVGAVLRVRAGAPLYVDASSVAVTPDGLTPATAFRDPIEAVLTAFAQGGGNVWIAEGTYANVAIQLWPGVHVYGGFDASFALAARDPATNVTLLQGRAGAAICEIVGGDPGAVLDGCALDGMSLAPFGIDVDQTTAELRDLSIERCAGRGLRLRSIRLDQATDVRLARCKVASNGAEGLSLSGAFDLWVEGSRFAANAFEGLDLDGLLGPDGVPVSLRVRDSAFAFNGQEGLDCDMLPPPAPGVGGGRFTVEIEGSSFEGNGTTGAASATAGLNLDIDFELVPDWRAEIVVRGCVAKSNRGDGIHLDLDSTCSAFVHRVLSTSNGGDGLSVTSETTPSFATVSASAFVGNVGAGVRASLGNVPVVAAHCVVAGNAGGGLVSSSVTSSASSSIAWLQPTPWSGVDDHFDVVATQPLTPPFVRVPIEYRRALSFTSPLLTLDDATTLVVGDTVELGDDAVVRGITSLGANNTAELDPTPTSPLLPALFTRFELPGDVGEDYHLALGSSAFAAGMPGLDGSVVDAGPFGAPLGGEVGVELGVRPVLFRASECVPRVGSTIASNAQISVSFADGTLDSLTVHSQSVRVVRGSGAVVAATFFEQGGALIVAPPGTGWPSGALVLELHSLLRATNGTPLATPVALAFVAQ